MTKKFKQICKCENCGNEAEMELTCSLEEVEEAEKKKREAKEPIDVKIKGSGTCTSCGSEADMWIDM